MLRAIWLTTQNEARLLVKDPIVLFMLLFAPVLIITVAGYSLGSLYGGSANSFRLPVVDLDHGKVAQGIIEALRREHGVALEMLDNPDEARRVVSRRDRTPIAMLIPAGTSAAVAAGGQPRLILFVDPVRRVEVNALELRIDELCRRITEQARTVAQSQIESFGEAQAILLPGDIGFVEEPAIEGEAVTVNAFDQYVPGFGVTFLLIGMMLGKLFARFIVGIAQMIVLFAVGWALFGISLGRNPLALIIPTVGISFAAAALALVVASIATAHDSVPSLGVTISISMAAVGGCWWPLDFEPGWMRELARWLPTTWTMQAFNDLMIRNQPPSAALLPLAATLGIGMIFLCAGLIRFVSLDD